MLARIDGVECWHSRNNTETTAHYIEFARKHGLTLADLSGTIFPYPTMMEGVKRTADAFQRQRLDGAGGRVLRKVISWIK